VPYQPGATPQLLDYPATLQLTHSTATDGAEVTYAYDPDGRLAKVTDATVTREFACDLQGQVVKESVALQPDPAAATPPSASPRASTSSACHPIQTT